MNSSGAADLTKTLPAGILIPSMAEIEPLMGSQAAWRKTRKALVLLAGLLNTEHSDIGMLDEILNDVELTAVLAPAPLARQNFQLTPFVAGMTAPQVSLATYSNKIYEVWMFYRKYFKQMILQAVGHTYVQRLAALDPLNLGLIRMTNAAICGQMSAWCITTDRDIKILKDALQTSFLWNNTVVSLQEHIIFVKQTHANLADANAPVNDNDKRHLFCEQVGGNSLLAQATDKYLDSAASPAVGGAPPDPPSFDALTLYMTTFVSLRTKDDSSSTYSLVAAAINNSSTSELESLRQENRSLRQQLNPSGGGGRGSGRHQTGRSPGRGEGRSGRGNGGRGATPGQRDRPKNSCYCWVHGFGQHYTLNECATVQSNLSAYTRSMITAVGPHSIPGHTGCTKRQLE